MILYKKVVFFVKLCLLSVELTFPLFKMTWFLISTEKKYFFGQNYVVPLSLIRSLTSRLTEMTVVYLSLSNSTDTNFG